MSPRSSQRALHYGAKINELIIETPIKTKIKGLLIYFENGRNSSLKKRRPRKSSILRCK